jgi:hypothetical protein
MLVCDNKRSTRSTDSNTATSTGQLRSIRKPLSTQNHIIMIPQPHPRLGPSIEMLCRRNRPTNTLLRLHRPELHERPSALDRRLVDSLTRIKVVRSFFERKVSFLGPRLAWRKHVVRFHDVVFDKGVLGPAVEGEVAGPFGIVGPGIFHDSGILLVLWRFHDARFLL